MSSSDGFRERGMQVTRTETFVDAAFAFAVTLLIIKLEKLPASSAELVATLKNIPAFALSFLFMAVHWNAHHRWSRRYGLDDTKATVLSLLLVFLVLIYVFPLRILFSTFFGWISQGYLPSEFRIDSMFDLKVTFATYAVAAITMSLCMSWLYQHAIGRREQLQLSAYEYWLSRVHLNVWRGQALVAMLSLLAALCLRDHWSPAWAALPGAVYFLSMANAPLAVRLAGKEPAK